VRFWTGMVNNFGVYLLDPTGPDPVPSPSTLGWGSPDVYKSPGYIQQRALYWMSGITSTTATIRVRGGDDEHAEDSKTWTCAPVDAPCFVDPDNGTCNVTRNYNADPRHVAMRDWTTYRCSSLGNILRGEVHFTAEYSAYDTGDRTVEALVREAFTILLGGVQVQCEQEMTYLPAGELETVTAKVRACLDFNDAQPKADFLARLAILNYSNPWVFQEVDREMLQRDTFAAVPAGATQGYEYSTCHASGCP